MAKKKQKRLRKAQAPPAAGKYVDWAFDDAHRLVAVDEVEHRLAIQQPDGTFAFMGKKGTGPGQFHYPKSIEVLNGTAYVVDSWNHRVQMFDVPAWTFKGAFDGAQEGAHQFFCPSSLALVPRGDEPPWLVVADTNNCRLTFHDFEGNYLFAHEPYHSGCPLKVRTSEGAIEVQCEDGQWEVAI